MSAYRISSRVAVVLVSGLIGLGAWGAETPKVLLTPGGVKVTPSSAKVSETLAEDASSLAVTCEPGEESYPGVDVTPTAAKAWDLSAYGHVEARVANTGDVPIGVTMRVDNSPGEWDAEIVSLKPGETKTVKVIFGYGYGFKPAHALRPGAVTAVKLFANKAAKRQSFRVEGLVAGGEAGEKPPVDPNSVRVRPAGGVIFGAGLIIEPAKQLAVHNATADVVAGGAAIRVAFGKSGQEQSVSVKPPVGKWDLRDALEVRVKLKNDGAAAVTPRVRVESEWKRGEWASAGTLAPGASEEIVASFVSPKVWDGSKGSGNQVIPGEVSAVTVAVDGGAEGRSLRIESIRAALPATAALPEWVGKRPPVEGDWTRTFDDEFDGSAIDLTKWNVKGENYYDKISHWSAQNVIVGGGVARLRMEKKRGPQNDDPKRNQTDYAVGFLDTFDKFAQRYGYFEARMKLPTSPGLWPAFWMMPDRGRDFEPKNWRTATEHGGMEFDIMEHLTRWGPLRYNIAMHWDGYGKDHKSIGSEDVLVQPDADGYVTCGLLWTPGSLVYYCNGREVLRWANERVSNVPGYLMFTMPTGGWDNDAVDDKALPADLVIDYVRVWQRGDLARLPAAVPTTAPAAKH